jgi:hypothetical protein
VAQLVHEKSNKFFMSTFYGPWVTPCQDLTHTPCLLLVFSPLFRPLYSLQVGVGDTDPNQFSGKEIPASFLVC